MDDQRLANYAESLYSIVNRTGNKQSASRRSKPSPENDDRDRSSILNEERKMGEADDGSIYDQNRIDLPFVSFGSAAETDLGAVLPSESQELTISLFDDDTLSQLLADFDAQLTQTMRSLDEAEKSIEAESNNNQQLQKQKLKKRTRMNGVTNGHPITSGDQNIVDKSIKQRRDKLDQSEPSSGRSLVGPGIEGPSSSAFHRNAPTFSSFKAPPQNLQKKMVTFDDRIQTFVRPQSINDSELSYHGDDGRLQLHQHQQLQQPSVVTTEEDEEKGVSDDGQSQRQSMNDEQSQQPVNESSIYEDVYARRSNSQEATDESRRYDDILTGNEPVDARANVSFDRLQVSDVDAPTAAAAAVGSDEFLSLGSDDDEEDDEEEEEDTDCMIRQTDRELPPTKVKALTVCRTVAVILAWLLAGIVAELPGPTMKYWTEYFSVSEELLSRVLATDGLGIVLGALLGGAASSRRHSDSALAVSMLLLICYPCTHSFTYYQLTAFLCAVARGAIFVGGMSAVTEMWQESRAAIWIHILHTTYSIGCFSAVHLANPFVQYLFQVEDRLTWSDPNVQHFPPPLVQVAHVDEDNTTMETGDIMKMPTSSVASQQSFPISSRSPVAATGRIPINIPLLYVPFAVVCLLLSLFFLCSSIFRTVRSLRRRNSRRKKRLMRQKNSGQHLKMPELDERKENVYEDTETDKKTDEQTEGDRVRDTTGRVQPKVNRIAITSKKNGFVHAEEGFLNGAFAHASGQELRMTEESTGGKPNAGQKSDSKGTLKRVRLKSEVTTRHSVPWFQGSQTFDVPILMFLYVCFVFPFGLEAALGIFLSVYAYSNKALEKDRLLQQVQSPDDAVDYIDVMVQLLSVFWASFILGRILAASLSRILSAGLLIIICLTINVLASAVLSAYADKYSTILWLFVAIFGGFLGPLIPGGLTWANVFLVATPKSIALAYCSAGLGWAICCWLSGFLVSYFGSSTLMYLVAGVSSLSILLFIPVLMKLGAPGTKRRSRSVRKPLSTYV